jgi:hypothetical protein
MYWFVGPFDAGPPVLQPCRLDSRIGHAENVRCTFIGVHKSIRVTENVHAVNLVVE